MITNNQTNHLLALELRPNNSASLKGMHTFCAIIAMAFLPVAMIFTYLGAWPVLIHVGVVLLFLYGAIRLRLRHNLAFEQIFISPAALVIEKCDHRGKRTRSSFLPHWLNIEIQKPGEAGSVITLRSHGKSLPFGKFLTPDEHLEVAAEINKALQSVRHI